MDRALLLLLRLRFRAWLRRTGRGLRTPRGLLLFAAGVATLCLWILPTALMAINTPRATAAPVSRVAFLLALPGFCLLTILSASRNRGIPFTPAEVDLLFSGPFTRRQLLVYKLSSTAAGSLVGALIFSLFLLNHAASWPAALAGVLFFLWFIQLLGLALALVAQTVGERAYTRARRILLAVVLTGAAVALGVIFTWTGPEGIMPAAKRLIEIPWVAWLLWPFEIFARVFAAPRFIPDLLGWSLAALAMNGALLALVMWLDVNYLESSLEASRRLAQRLQRVRRGQTAWGARATRRGAELIRLPWLAGAGPIISRQWAIARGRGGAAGFVLLMAMAGFAIPVFAGQSHRGGIDAGPLAGFLVMINFMLPQLLTFDFRGDIDNMDWLKSLPLSATAMAVGELAVPVLLMTGVNWLAIAALAAFVRAGLWILVAAAAFAPPVSFMLLGVQNLTFLVFPTRQSTFGFGDPQQLGRAMLEAFARLLVLGLAGAAAAGVGALVYVLGGRIWLLALAAAWVVVAAGAAGLVPLIAWAYRRYDVSLDTPA